ncbi:MAG: metallophosphoesterase family protein [Lentisphaerae bacterium]|nr:metallophosphoesterase family protein [Lentisphaerota bacterium]
MNDYRTVTRQLDDAFDRLIIVSDLHAHLPPLKAFEERCSQLKGRSQVLFNGDLFLGGPHPAETARWVMAAAGELATLGNHDEGMLQGAQGLPACPSPARELGQGNHPPYTEEGAFLRLSEEQRDYFRALPRRLILRWRGKKIVLCHGHADPATGEEVSWRSPPDEQIARFLDPSADLCATGHTHYAFVRQVKRITYANSGSLSLPILAALDKTGLHPQSGKKELGADDDPRSSFLEVTESGGKLNVAILRFDYDRAQVWRELEALGHPQANVIRRWLKDGILEV